MISRRNVAAAFGGLPFVGPLIAKETMAGLSQGGGPPTTAYPRPPGEKSLDGVYANNILKGKAPNPLISKEQAIKLLLQNKELLDEITSQMYAHERTIGHIDADIDVMKSLSRMAKITFQRQRNVERSLKNVTTNHSNYWGDQVSQFIQRVMFGGKT